MKNRGNAESLVDTLKYEMAGSREDRRQAAIELLKEILREKALKKLRPKFMNQGWKTLGLLIEDLEELKDVWADEEVAGKVKLKAKSKSKAKAKAKVKDESGKEEKVEG